MLRRKSKLLLVCLITALVLNILMLSSTVPSVEATGETSTFSSSTSDGMIDWYGSNYGQVRNKTEGDVNLEVWVGQAFAGSLYYVFRGFVFFDTSSIPDNRFVESAILSLYVEQDVTTNDFNITIQSGMPTYPHDPLEVGDYYYTHYSGNGGTFDTTGLSAGYNNITLNSEGLSWINKVGWTKLCLRSDKDIDYVAPTDNAYVDFKEREDGLNKSPKLYVTWGYKYTFYGVYDEDTGLLKSAGERAVNVTSYFADGTASETFEVNGTYSYYSASIPEYFHLNTSSPREYWVGNAEYTAEIYIFDDSLTAYYISFLDLGGVLETYAWVSASRYINGSLMVVEKRKVDVEKAFTMSLQNGEKYTIQVEAEAGTSYTFGELLMTSDTTVDLTIKGLEFPQNIILAYKYVRVYAERTFGASGTGNITITYQDTLNETTQVDIYINYNNGTNAYNATETSDSFVHTWSSADNETDYYGEAIINHQRFGVLTERWYFPRSFAESPWGLDVFGSLPFDTSIIIPAFIIICVAGVFSVLTVPVAAILVTTTATAITYLGWMDIDPGALVAAWAFSIILALIWAKRKVTT